MPSEPASSREVLSAPEATPALSTGTEARHRGRQRRRQRRAERGDEQAGHDVEVVRTCVGARDEVQPGGEEQHSRRDDPGCAEPLRELCAERRGDDEDGGHRREREPTLDGRKAEDALQVEREEEEDAEEPEPGQDEHDVAAGEPGPRKSERSSIGSFRRSS